jgi:cathepsin D
VSLTFGGVNYQISSQDFIVDQVSTRYCLAAFFVLELNSGSSPIPGLGNSNNPTWVVGDSFLKNVYTVFRADPASVGFGNLSSTTGAIGLAGTEIRNGNATIVNSGSYQGHSAASSVNVALSALFAGVAATVVGLWV